ncbi:MAG: thiamine phosphate synthase [Verrucomicrobia bacterium]|nr:thiamine phosphate synthase [Verrucomicrobiota bacterium]
MADESTFPPCPFTPLRLYPIVDRAEWVRKLLPLGVSTIQLRAKDLEGEELEREVQQAIKYAREYDARLFINDAWELALKHGAYGVHIGQDDISRTGFGALASSGMRLGISTHSEKEIEVALWLNPSYVAIGTVFHTSSKKMNYGPLGLNEFTRLRAITPCPVVAIGGIHLGNAAEVFDAGADACAVISEIRDAEDLEATVNAWRTLTAC